MWLIRGRVVGSAEDLWISGGSGGSREDLGRVLVSIARGSGGSQEDLGRISGGYQIASQEDLEDLRKDLGRISGGYQLVSQENLEDLRKI